jgi:MFS family permease
MSRSTRNPLAHHVAVIGLVECAHGALLYTLLPNHLRFGIGHPMSVVGLTLSVYFIAELLAKVPSGWMVDHWGRRIPLYGGLALSVLAVLMFSRVEAPVAILLAAAIAGLGAAPIWPSLVSGVAESTEPGGRGGAMGAVFTAWMLGTGTGFVVANFLLEINTAVAFGFVATCLVGALVPARMLTANRSTGHVQEDLRESLHEVLKTAARLWPLIGGMFLQTISIGMLMPILSPYAREVLTLSPFWIGALLVAGPGLTILLLIPLGRIIDRVDRVEVLPVSLGLSAAVLFALPFFQSMWILVPLVAILGLGYATMLPAWNALIMDLLPPARRATLLSLAMSVEGMGIAIGTTIGGVLWDVVGPSTPFHAAALVLIVVAMGYVALLPKSVGPMLRRRARRRARRTGQAS